MANSTVFGGIAGETMAAWVASEGAFRDPDAGAIDAALARAEHPFRDGSAGDLESVRERLYATMWDDAGIIRDAASLARADATLTSLAAELEAFRLPLAARDRAFNLTWHDWLNLDSLVSVSRAIVAAALARTNSRGAHYRSDFPDAGDLATSTYIQVRQHGAGFACAAVPVRFQRVRPGESLLRS